MKPWMTDAMGTQKVVAPSSVVHADFATSEKFCMPARSLSGASWPFSNMASVRSNGRQVIRSPAVPASSLALTAELYSVGAIGAKVTLMLGCLASKVGMIFSCQIGRSSLRQLSMVGVVSCAIAMPAGASTVVAKSMPFSMRVMSFSLLFALSGAFVELLCLVELGQGRPQGIARPGKCCPCGI